MKSAVVIDSDLEFIGVVRELFRDSGTEFETCPDGQSGLAQVRTSRPDVVVASVELGGFAICARIRRDATLRGTVVVLTQRSDGSDVDFTAHKLSQNAADAYVVKPTTVPDLARVMDMTLTGDDDVDLDVVGDAEDDALPLQEVDLTDQLADVYNDGLSDISVDDLRGGPTAAAPLPSAIRREGPEVSGSFGDDMGRRLVRSLEHQMTQVSHLKADIKDRETDLETERAKVAELKKELSDMQAVFTAADVPGKELRIQELEVELKRVIVSLKAEADRQMASAGAEFEAQMASVRTELERQVDSVRANLERSVVSLEAAEQRAEVTAELAAQDKKNAQALAEDLEKRLKFVEEQRAKLETEVDLLRIELTRDEEVRTQLVTEHSSTISVLEAEKSDLSRQLSDFKLKAQQFESDYASEVTSRRSAQQELQELRSRYEKLSIEYTSTAEIRNRFEQRLAISEARLAEVDGRLAQTQQELAHLAQLLSEREKTHQETVRDLSSRLEERDETVKRTEELLARIQKSSSDNGATPRSKMGSD